MIVLLRLDVLISCNLKSSYLPTSRLSRFNGLASTMKRLRHAAFGDQKGGRTQRF